MRGLRSTLVLLVVAIGLGAYIYFVERHRDPASTPAPNEKLFTFDADDLTELQVRAEDGTVTELRQDDGAWRVVAPVETAADDVAATSVAASLATLEINRVLEEGPVDLEPFGLDAPALDVSFAAAGDSQRLLVGDATPTGADRYAKLDGSDRVFLIAGYHSTSFNKTAFDSAGQDRPRLRSGRARPAEIASGGETIEFSKDGDDWRLAAPLAAAADFGAVEGLIGSLGGGQMRAVESETADALEPFGLDAPAHTISLHAGSATATLHVGAETPDGTYYARDAARPLVFTVDASLVTSLERDASEYRPQGPVRLPAVQRQPPGGRARGRGRRLREARGGRKRRRRGRGRHLGAGGAGYRQRAARRDGRPVVEAVRPAGRVVRGIPQGSRAWPGAGGGDGPGAIRG